MVKFLAGLLAGLVLGGTAHAVSTGVSGNPAPSGPTLHCGTVTSTDHTCTVKDTGHPERFRVRYVLNDEPVFGVKFANSGKPIARLAK